MKKLILASVAAAAISFPAFAQQSKAPDQGNMTNKSDTSNKSDMSNQGSMSEQSGANESTSNQASSQSSGQAISPDSLSQSQVKQLQQALDEKGFKVGKVDGKWGPETESALRKFQEAQKLPSKGELDQQTAAALGLNGSEFGAAPETTGQGERQQQTTGQGEQMKKQENAPAGENQNNQSSPGGSGNKY